jgi:hypothetical protein
MFVTRRPHGAKPQVKGAQGRPVSPTPWSAGHAPKSVYKSIPYPRVSENREEWSAGHVDGRHAVHHLQTNSIKLVEAPLDVYIRILMVELTDTTLYL